VVEASAAAAAAGELLSAAVIPCFETPFLPGADISRKNLAWVSLSAIGGTNIAGIIDVAELRDYAATLPR